MFITRQRTPSSTEWIFFARVFSFIKNYASIFYCTVLIDLLNSIYILLLLFTRVLLYVTHQRPLSDASDNKWRYFNYFHIIYKGEKVGIMSLIKTAVAQRTSGAYHENNWVVISKLWNAWGKIVRTSAHVCNWDWPMWPTCKIKRRLGYDIGVDMLLKTRLHVWCQQNKKNKKRNGHFPLRMCDQERLGWPMAI